MARQPLSYRRYLGCYYISFYNYLFPAKSSSDNCQKIGQIEIDELYVGVDSQGQHYVVPVQAKGGKNQISVVQTTQDMRACEEKFVGVRCRPVSVQFMPDKTIAMFELTLQDGELRVVDERHYRLVAGDRPRVPKMQKRAS